MALQYVLGKGDIVGTTEECRSRISLGRMRRPDLPRVPMAWSLTVGRTWATREVDGNTVVAGEAVMSTKGAVGAAEVVGRATKVVDGAAGLAEEVTAVAESGDTPG